MSASDATNNGSHITGDGHEIPFEAYGVRMAIGASHPELLDQIRPFLPPGWKSCPSSEVRRRLSIIAEPAGTYGLVEDGRVLHPRLNLDLALMLIDSELRLYIARKAPNAIFIHAGVIAHRGRAVILPGLSFAGKTTLVAALVREGAIYYSDEFAVLGEDGLVHPYAKSLSLRDHNQIQIERPVDTLGGIAGEEPLPLAAIVVTSYKRDALWEPRRLTVGEGAMTLLANAVPARERPDEVMRAISRASDGAIVIESARGEAEEVAPLLLAELDQLTV